MSRDLIEKSQNPESSRENDNSSTEEGPSRKRSRGLLHVPSRSSSQKNQPSPTATGLSGVTASDSRDSIGDRSKGSKASIMGRHRNGSASSNRSAVEMGQTATSGPAAAPAQQRKKKGGLLSLLCCGVPDDANVAGNEPGDVPGHKVEKLPPRPTTASRRQTPSEQSASKPPLQEKDVSQGQTNTDATKAKRVSGATTQDQSTLAEESKPSTLTGTAPPAVTVDPPSPDASVPGPAGLETSTKDQDGDTEMADAIAETTEPAVQPVEVDDLQNLPPAPPMPAAPIPPTDAESGLIAAPEQPQQEWLLPPILPQHQGRKCLVLDLDETLVHSSFKVSSPLPLSHPAQSSANCHLTNCLQILHQADFTIPVEIEGNYHNVYVIKRPGVDQFMKRVGELYEVVVFTASVSKVRSLT